jgi:DNA polymerase-3 subunit delta
VDFAAFARAAERGQLPRVALVHGADAQLLDDALALATRALFPDPSLIPLGREVVDAREVTADAVVRTAMTLPLMTPARLVAVRHVQAWAAKAGPAVAGYVANPSPTTCLLLLADESLEGGRDTRAHWLLGAVSGAARADGPVGATDGVVVVAMPERRGRALEEWLRQRAEAEGLRLSQEGARLLVEWVGDDTAALLGEARKAALAGVGGQGTVGVKEVTAVVGEHRLAGVFDLTRAVERREVGLALRLLDRLLVTEEPMRLLTILTGDVRTSWAVLERTRRGERPDQIARALRRPPAAIAAHVARTAAVSPAVLATKLRRCWEVEHRLKSGADAAAELAALVVELCN